MCSTAAIQVPPAPPRDDAPTRRALMIAEANPHLTGVTFDLDPVTPIAQANLEQCGVGNRVTAVSGDFFVDPFPAADVYFMGNILHDWNEAEKLALIGKAYEALPAGGVLVAIENVIDDERRVNSFGLLMSLNMLIELHGGPAELSICQGLLFAAGAVSDGRDCSRSSTGRDCPEP